MTLAELRTEFYARGFDFDDATRTNRWLNQAYQELCEETAWPFLEVSASSTAPLSLTDVRTILSVSDTTQGITLDGMDRRDVVDYDPDLNETGNPTHWFLDDNTLRVYPLNTTNTITVRYVEVPDAMAADGDSPDIPERYQDLIVDGAVIRAYKDTDEIDAAVALREMWDQGVYRMRRSMMDRNLQNPGTILITDTDGWSL